MKLGACVQPPHLLKNHPQNKNTISKRHDTDVFLPDFGWEEGVAVHRTSDHSAVSEWRWMTLKSFAINFSEFPDKFSPILKNGTVLFFVQIKAKYFLVLCNNSPQSTQIISENSQVAFYFVVFFSSFCFERSVDVEFKLRVLTVYS